MIESSVSTSSELSCVSVRSQTNRDENNYYRPVAGGGAEGA